MKDDGLIERLSQESRDAPVQIPGPTDVGLGISGVIGDVIGLETTLNLKQVD